MRKKKGSIEFRRRLRGIQNHQKYPYLKVIKLFAISKMLGYNCPHGQGILPTFGGHERFFERINDAVKGVVESLGGSSYQRNHKHMEGNPICSKDKRITELEEGINEISLILGKFQISRSLGDGESDVIFANAMKGVQIQDIIENLKRKELQIYKNGKLE